MVYNNIVISCFSKSREKPSRDSDIQSGNVSKKPRKHPQEVFVQFLPKLVKNLDSGKGHHFSDCATCLYLHWVCEGLQFAFTNFRVYTLVNFRQGRDTQECDYAKDKARQERNKMFKRHRGGTQDQPGKSQDRTQPREFYLPNTQSQHVANASSPKRMWKESEWWPRFCWHQVILCKSKISLVLCHAKPFRRF